MKKYFFLGAIIIILSGCLVPGAPHRFYFLSKTNKCDTAVVVTYPLRDMEYQFRSCDYDFDSVLVFDGTLNKYTKLARTIDSRYYFLYNKRKRVEVKKNENLKLLYIKKIKNNKGLNDTLFFSEQPKSLN